MKKVIGILAPTRNNDVDSFDNAIICPVNYLKWINEVNCIPLGLFFLKGKFNEEIADLCDAFIITGGKDVESVGINLVHYAIKNNKPLLGICLGMQTMAAYEWVIDRLGDNATYEEIDNFYDDKYIPEYLDDVVGHDNVEPFEISKIEHSKHDVLIADNNSYLYDIFKSNVINMPSLHKQKIKKDFNMNRFKVVAKSPDDVVEAIEYNGENFILGVQFHPELEENNIKIFKYLKDKIKSE